MAQSQAVSSPSTGHEAPAQARWHLLGRVAWVAVALLALALFAAGFPVRLARLAAFAEEYRRPLLELGLSPRLYVFYVTGLDLTIILAHTLLAALTFWRRPHDRGALLVALALITVPLTVTHTLPEDGPGLRLAAQLVQFIGLTATTTLLYLFPDGRFVPRWTRFMALAWAAVAFSAVFLPQAWFSVPSWPGGLQWLTLLGIVGVGVWAQWHRYTRVSSPLQREQARWALFGLVAAALAPFGYFFPLITLPSLSQTSPPAVFYQIAGPTFFTWLLLYRLIGATVFSAGLLLFPLSFAVAILRYRLWEMNLLISRTLVYGTLSVSVAGLYVITVGALAALFQTRGSLLVSIVATGLVAVLFQPLRERLQRAVNRLLYGERDDPQRLLATLGSHLERAAAPEQLLPTLVETVARALKLPFVAIALTGQDGLHVPTEAGHSAAQDGAIVVAAWGEATRAAVALPLVYQGEPVGQLRVAPREGDEALHPADRRLLEQIALQAGAAAYTVRLTTALRRSREQLVLTREEERRRLRRDLHDDLGPQLASLTLKLDAARNLLAGDPAATDRLLVELKGQVQTSIAEVRRIAHELRPPVLDQLGLVPALREYAAAQQLGGVQITIAAPEPLPPLPAAVEVAAYRIALEALTNVARHADARRCTVRLTVDDGLRVEICDDGRGLPAHPRGGVGLASMRARAEELGGSLAIESAPGAGTAVRAHLPLGSAGADRR